MSTCTIHTLPHVRVGQALADAGLPTAGPRLRELAATTLTYVDLFPATSPADELTGYISHRLPALSSDRRAALRLLAESPELYDATCPPAELAAEDMLREEPFPQDLSPAAVAWRTVYALVAWLVRDELERAGATAAVAA